MEEKGNRSKTLSIGEVSKLYDIPITTLRYFEEFGLLTTEHDENNNYRVFTANQIAYDLVNSMFFRDLGIPLKQIKEVRKQPLPELRQTLKNSQKNIEQKIKEYHKKLSAINKKVSLIDEIYNTYDEFKEVDLPFEKAVQFDYSNKEHLKAVLSDTSRLFNCGLVGNDEQDMRCLIVNDDYSGEVSFRKNKKDKYLMTYYRTDTTDKKSDFNDKLQKLADMGYKSNFCIVQLIFDIHDDNMPYQFNRVYFKIEE